MAGAGSLEGTCKLLRFDGAWRFMVASVANCSSYWPVNHLLGSLLYMFVYIIVSYRYQENKKKKKEVVREAEQREERRKRAKLVLVFPPHHVHFFDCMGSGGSMNWIRFPTTAD